MVPMEGDAMFHRSYASPPERGSIDRMRAYEARVGKRGENKCANPMRRAASPTNLCRRNVVRGL